ncbi:MAG: N-acetylmuramoyl-L-alanine amidase [Bacteroidales bacterium]|nr:N-acetylmuramoyl-L-alanine amidase [Bacteroidales bacterium]MDD4058194.1 N-acetylmuramoyl-L-alanine amidase [Bacteroidales bacterium]
MLHKVLLIFFCLLLQMPLQAQSNSRVALRKVVIDPGHGGKDPGAVSINKRHREKDITLAVSLMLGKLIKESFPEIEVVYTRSTDLFIPLDKRSEIANKEKADLFISIHVNSARARSASGTETFVMGLDKSSSNLEVSKLENSVIVLEGDNYSTKYEGFDPNVPESYIIFSLLQNAHLEHSLSFASFVQEQLAKGPVKTNRGVKQAGLLVLWKATMPAVLVELGFISNSSDLAVLLKRANQESMARSLFTAFSNFKRVYETGGGGSLAVSAPSKPLENNKPILSEEKKIINSEEYYSIQILAVTKRLNNNAPDLKGLKQYDYKRVGAFYKYHTGVHTDRIEASEALKVIRRKFPQAFIIRIENNTIVPLK